jgi:hypothetical protein
MQVRGMAEQRLKAEHMDNDKDVVDPKGRFYGRPVDYAMDK